MTGTTLATIVHGVMALAIVAAATTLLALGSMDSTTAMALFGAAIGLIGGSAGIALALKVPPKE
jgi:ABC-type nickel/cobalt efflux system permease component RcnA